MDKNAIKKYAVWARRELISRVTQKALQYGITDSGYGDRDADSINGNLLSSTEKTQRKALIQKISGYADYKSGYEQVIEEVAYTWFNRFTALRFMEVNGYLPTHIRVFTDDNNAFKPQILNEALHIDLFGLNRDVVLRLKEANNESELYKYLLITQCNALGDVLPGMFERILSYTELLFPDNLLRDGSVIERMISEIPEGDWNVGEQGQVEIIGWLYQYYISEKHEEVIDPLHGKIIKKEDVPAATQLFTTDWVVRYITDNSLGRYWIERNPNSTLRESLQYFVMPKSGEMQYVNETIDPRDLTVLDPCVGSGHFLTYAFDVLMKIYSECGYSTRDAVSNIVRNNLYGLDIDERATQLAYFAVMMKACAYDSRFLSRKIQPNIYAIEESNGIKPEYLQIFCDDHNELKVDIMSVIDQMRDAKEYGSIIQITPVNFDALYERLRDLYDNSDILGNAAYEHLLPIVQVAEVLSKKYKTVITNPPYLNKFSSKLKSYIESNYADYKGDLFSVFMYRNFALCDNNGYTGFMTPFVWMFIQMYGKLREYIINNKSIVTLIQMEYSAYEEAIVPICTFVLKNGKETSCGLYFRLSNFRGGMEIQKQKVLEALTSNVCNYFFESTESNFTKITGSPIAYWVGEKTLNVYSFNKLSDYVDCKSGIMTGNDDFIKLWHEVNNKHIKFDCTNSEDMGDYIWFPLNSGGEFRKWYGNNQKIVDLWNNGARIKATVKNYRLRDPRYYFQGGITWGRITSSQIAFREVTAGTLFGDAGPIGFIQNNRRYVLAFLCGKVVKHLLAITNPTLNFQVHDIMDLPLSLSDTHISIVEQTSSQNIDISKSDWDSFETSWDFKKHPLI